jgi:NIMA (never in mitosis gene a)-related kinase
MDKFIIRKKLGSGSFGIVYKVRRKKDNKSYALKQINLQNMDRRQIQDSLNEVRLLASLKHPHLVSFLEAFPCGRHRYNLKLCIIMEYARGGDLANEIKRNRRLMKKIPEETIWKYAKQISDALSFLHSYKIIHRDIKAANCFLTSSGDIKIGDMNISKLTKYNQMARTKIGTPYYMSPEIWNNIPYGNKCDVWSLGCLLYELATFKVPFEGYSVEDLARRVRMGHYKRSPNKFYSNKLWSLIHSMLVVRPISRISMDDVFSKTSLHCSTLHFQTKFSERKANILGTIHMMPSIKLLNSKMPEPQYENENKRLRIYKIPKYPAIIEKTELPIPVKGSVANVLQKAPLNDKNNYEKKSVNIAFPWIKY